MALSEVHLCQRCGRKLPINHVVGQVQVFCRYCKGTTMVTVSGPMIRREW